MALNTMQIKSEWRPFSLALCLFMNAINQPCSSTQIGLGWTGYEYIELNLHLD